MSSPRGSGLYRRSKRPALSAHPAPPSGTPAAIDPAAQDSGARNQVRQISSLTNDLVKDMRGLQSKKERAETGLFLAEGLKLVTDAFAAGWTVRTLAYAEKVRSQPMVARAVDAALARGVDVVEVSEAVLEKISRRDNPQMVVSVIEQRFAAIEAINFDRATVIVALEGIKDPGNLGTVIRTVDSVGASAVVLVGETTDPFAIEAVRATMGSIFHVPIAKASAEAFITLVKAKRLAVYGTHLAGAVDYRSPDYPEPAVLLMGNEQSGLPQVLVDACTEVIKIPMAGQADSLNLAVATGVALYEMRRKRLKL
ncbi:MAG: RNA methyltransferase [Ancalomicrobiaceae bacterium]|nr:RNA methyltransferase [Ancalomicrobiaceae bacterium]